MVNHLPKPAVLVVDDDSMLLQLIARSLKNDFVVKVAISGADGLAKFDHAPFDAVIVDRAMPGMPGDVFAAKIKERAPHVPIILISGFPDGLVDPALFHAFLPKPFTKNQVIEALSNALVTVQ